MAGNLKVGECISIQGRIQSREYHKWVSGTEPETLVAYEVSASVIKVEMGGGKP